MVDVDGVCDFHDPLDDLVALKASIPSFKATAFLIPKRCSNGLLRRYKKHAKWLHLGMHGWRHTFGECYSWNPSEAEDKILWGVGNGIGGVFRAPSWITSPIIYEVCGKHNVVVADRKEWNCSTTPMPRVYRFDEPHVLYKPIHMNSTIDEYAEAAIRIPNATFAWVSDIAWKI